LTETFGVTVQAYMYIKHSMPILSLKLKCLQNNIITRDKAPKGKHNCFTTGSRKPGHNKTTRHRHSKLVKSPADFSILWLPTICTRKGQNVRNMRQLRQLWRKIMPVGSRLI